MGTQTKQAAALADATIRFRSSDSRYDHGGNSGDGHLPVGQDVAPSVHLTYRSYVKCDFSGAFWTGVYQIVRAELVLKSTSGVHLVFGAKPRLKVQRLTNAFGTPGGGEGVWDSGYYGAIGAGATATGEATPILPTTTGQVSSIDITGIVELWAPVTVKRRDGSPGGAVADYGVRLTAYDETTGDNRIEFYSKEDATPGNRPYILLTYEEGPRAPSPPTLGEPSGDEANGPTAFTGAFTDPNPGDTLRQTEIEVYLGSGGAKAWGGIFDASPADQTAGTFSVPYPASLKSLTDYEWRAKVSDGQFWSDWSATSRPYRTYRVLNSAPTATLVPLADRATLASTLFRAGFSDPDGDSLFAYQVQMRPGTLGANDSAWDGYDNLWDTGPTYPSASEIGESRYATPYGGRSLSAGTYSWRTRALDSRGAWSAWVVDTFVLTADFDIDPGSPTNALTGQFPVRPPARVVFRAITLDAWTFRVEATGGSWTISYEGRTTGALNYAISASSLKAALEALILNGVVATVNLNTAGNVRTYTVTLAGIEKISLLEATSSLTGSPNSLSVTCNATRGPGPIVAIVEDPSGLGASKYLNGPGEFHMTLGALHFAAGEIEPFQVHYSVELWWGDRFRPIFEGLVTDFDATGDDVVWFGVDYLGLLDLTVDERFDITNPDKPHSQGGSKYVAQQISAVITDQFNDSRSLDNSPVKFITNGAIDTFSEIVTIYSTYSPRLTFINGLIQSHKQGSGKKSRVWVERTIAGEYRWRLSDDVGFERPDLKLEWGGLVTDAHIIGFGDFAVVGVGIGRTTQGTQVLFRQAAAPGMRPEVYGRIVRPFYYQDLQDVNDLARRIAQDAAKMGRVGKRLALALKVDALQPFDGYDLGDQFPVAIKRGIIDTTRYGSGYWTLAGLEWSLGDQGQSDVTLVLLPREDGVSPNPDLLPFTGVYSSEWQVGWQGPPDEATSRYYLDLVSGKVYVRDFNTGEWILLNEWPNPYFQVTDLNDALNVIKMEAGYLWYSTDGGISWDKFWGAGGGTLPGGSNLIPDGSFEMVAFPASVPNTAQWDTDTEFNDTDPAGGQRAALNGMVTSGTGAGAVIQLDSAT